MLAAWVGAGAVIVGGRARAEEDPQKVQDFLGFVTTTKPSIEQYSEDTRKLMGMAKTLLDGDDVSPEFQKKFVDEAEVWLGRYKFNHGKYLESYADLFNVQAKLTVQLLTDEAKGQPFDPEHTIFNRPALQKRLAKGARALENGE